MTPRRPAVPNFRATAKRSWMASSSSLTLSSSGFRSASARSAASQRAYISLYISKYTCTFYGWYYTKYTNFCAVCQLNFGYFYRFVALVLQGRFRSAPPCSASLVLTAFCLYVFLLETQKEPKRSPLLPIAREARLKSAGFVLRTNASQSALLRI